jgi:NADPH:quinone reductase-like Zn-dependent oxidoreductase
MKAVRIHAYGAPEVLAFEDAPKPEPGAGEVLVRVRAAGVNPIDSRSRAGAGVVRYWKDVALPVIVGWDLSGVVEACGAGVSGFRIGDEVFGLVRFPQPGSAYAQYVAAPAEHLAHKPRSVDHLHAAALPLSSITAWMALFDAAKLEAGQSVLVHAAAGGVGHLAVQLAKWKGAKVTGTASGRNEQFVRSLGVDAFIDYTKTPFEQAIKDVDVQLDTVGKAVQERCWGVMKKGGAVVSIVPDGGPLSQEKAAEAGMRAINVVVRPNAAALREIAALVDAGKLKPSIEKSFPLAEARQAHEHISGGHTRGKLVLEVG